MDWGGVLESIFYGLLEVYLELAGRFFVKVIVEQGWKIFRYE